MEVFNMKKILSVLLAISLLLSGSLSACARNPAAKGFDFSQPVPEGDLMGEDWFDDSVFIGHSLIVGFEAFTELYSNPTYLAITGLSAAGALKSSKFSLPDGSTGTLTQGLSQRQFSKAYIMLGTNEASSSSATYKKNMAAIVDLVRQNQGNIPIYLINSPPTTQRQSDTTAFNITNLTRLNAALLELAEEKECYYLDLYSYFADENGYLPAEKSTDGVHLKSGQYRYMADFLLSHTVTEETPTN